MNSSLCYFGYEDVHNATSIHLSNNLSTCVISRHFSAFVP